MRIRAWSSDVCSSDLVAQRPLGGDGILEDVVAADHRGSGAGRQETADHLHRRGLAGAVRTEEAEHLAGRHLEAEAVDRDLRPEALHQTAHRKGVRHRSEEHTSELQSLMRISYAVFCL